MKWDWIWAWAAAVPAAVVAMVAVKRSDLLADQVYAAIGLAFARSRCSPAPAWRWRRTAWECSYESWTRDMLAPDFTPWQPRRQRLFWRDACWRFAAAGEA